MGAFETFQNLNPQLNVADGNFPNEFSTTRADQVVAPRVRIDVAARLWGMW